MGTAGKLNKAFRIIGTLLGAAILCGIGAYLGIAYYYSNKFLPGTEINSIDCSGLTVDECESLIRTQVEDYTLTVKSRDYDDETITAEEIGYTFSSDGDAGEILDAQNSLTWLLGYFVQTDYTAGVAITYDEELVRERMERLECMLPENQVQPEDAHIEFQGTLFAIVAGDEGSAIDEDIAFDALITALDHGEDSVDLEETGAYLEPTVREDDESLVERLKIVNTYAKASITLTIGTETEVIDGTVIKDWYSYDENGALYLDGTVLREKLTEYVADLASKYDTVGTERTFTATSGRTVTVSGGTYGWAIDESAEIEALYEEILNGEQTEREINFSSSGNYWDGETDIGSTYIEVDLSEQHMYYYQDDEVIFESDFVSGNMSYEDRMTPESVSKLSYKTTDFTLRGEQDEDGEYEYEEDVEYWMPFNGGVGFHDAPWRSEFGGDIYLTSGSHGCINLPSDKAAELYELIDYDIPIIVFY